MWACMPMLSWHAVLDCMVRQRCAGWATQHRSLHSTLFCPYQGAALIPAQSCRPAMPASASTASLKGLGAEAQHLRKCAGAGAVKVAAAAQAWQALQASAEAVLARLTAKGAADIIARSYALPWLPEQPARTAAAHSTYISELLMYLQACCPASLSCSRCSNAHM